MKYAISSTGTTLDSALDTRFGRTTYFLIYDTESRTLEAVENKQNLQALQGAGIQSAVRVAENGADIVLTGHCGPKAFRVLQEAGIKVYLTEAATCQEALEQFEEGILKESTGADVESHW